ncbi:MAG TPA: carbonic anhydrase [Nitriliruptorales bacterium]
MTQSLPKFADLIEGNRRFVASFSDEEAEASKVPTRELVVVSCMDARVDPWRALGLGPGEAHIVRNAGGRASQDTVRSIAVSAAALGTRRVAVIHHTDCGMLGSEEQIRAAVRERGAEVDDGVEFLTFTDSEDSVRDDVRTLRASPLVPDDLEIAGFLYDVATGQLTAIPA